MKKKRLLCASVLLAALSACGDADNAIVAAPAAVVGNTGAPGIAKSLALSRDQSLISLTGRVVSTTPSAFQLNHGRGVVTVEMDDWDWYQEGRGLTVGDEVVVRGKVDQDLLERRTIEASMVFVKNLGVYFYASGADEEVPTTLAYVPPSDGLSDITGVVASMEGNEFTVGGTSGPIRVDLANLEAAPKVKVGDRVYAWGTIDIDPRERTELMAAGVVILSADKTKKTPETEAT